MGIRIFEPMLVLIFIFHDLKTEVMFEAEVMVDTDAGCEIAPNTFTVQSLWRPNPEN